ncbi:nicotinamidase-related amidase [Prauserella shujinwangii]|uniref:Nicotinamidase-related amidase n=1 Tax=Prauserella shujinwangii TaxID=1453103 RepID=A0A2T0LSJ4_9PSEU|nr:isochorismatase family protein [Prauserella shujinwangii]PRX46628.1 nicotinamidase-related amidase [Prauserella shujinwangii]
MSLEPLTPENTTIVLVDHAVGFANVLRSHDTAQHVGNVVGLAKTARLYGTGLVVTNGMPTKPSGPLYPELLEVLGDHPVIERGGNFDAFLDDAFADAVRATGRRKLAIAGVSTEGCVLQTVLGGLRAGYEVYLVVDASASLTAETHETAVRRMVQAGAVPVTWFSLAGEFTVDHRSPSAPHFQQLMREHVPTMAMGVRTWRSALEHAPVA